MLFPRLILATWGMRGNEMLLRGLELLISLVAIGGCIWRFTWVRFGVMVESVRILAFQNGSIYPNQVRFPKADCGHLSS